MDSLETKIRNLLDLPPCDCGQGIHCPEITLNMYGHPNEEAVVALLVASERGETQGELYSIESVAQDGGGPWWQEFETEIYAEQFGLLCDYFWRLDHPETPKDGLLHTSDVCRKRAGEVLDLLDFEWWKRAGEGLDDVAGESGREN